MPTVWFALKRSLHCKTGPDDVHDPKTKKEQQLASILTRKTSRSGCSRSIANLKDVIHGSKRHLSKPPSCSPRSIGSSEFLNPITHEVVLGGNSRCELKITSFAGDASVGTLTPGTPMHYFNNRAQNQSTPPRMKSHLRFAEKECLVGSNGGSAVFSSRRSSRSGVGGRVFLDGGDSINGVSNSNSITCHKCGEQFSKWEAAEAHHLSKHAVTELVEGDSSRKIVEIICKTGWLNSEKNNSGRIEKVLKVHNMQKTLARFEEYRETVKIRASKLPKKHPRCLADGNELLRFYGTTVACSLGLNNSSNLCISERCCVCRIIRTGFSAKKEMKGGIGVFTTSTSGRAFESIEVSEDDALIRKALIVCRVVAGRVHRPVENIQEISGQVGFDSLAGKVGVYSHIEELYLLNPRALLPCFVVICKS